LSFRSNTTYSTLLKAARKAARERAAELTAQTLSLRGRAAAGVAGGAALGVLTLGSAVGALAAADPAETATATAAGQSAGAGKAGRAAGVRPEQVAEKAGSMAAKAGKAAAKKVTGTAESADSTSATAREVIKLAEKQVGISEGKGSMTKFHDWYVKSPAAKLTAARDGGEIAEYKGASWCDMFVSWVGEKTGAKGMGADAWTVAHAKWFKKTDRWGETPRPGAVVFFDWEDEGVDAIKHVGLVVKKNSNGTISTIEGNTGDAVKKKVRKPAQIAGYGYPDYRK
jgi:CHAP domain